MASIGSLTVPVDFEITEVSKQVLKPLVAQCISEALEDSQTIIKSEEDLRAFVQAEVRKALKDIMHEYEAEITEKGATSNMGGKPNPGTRKDMRLSRNNPNAGKPAQPKPAPAPKKASK